MAQPRRFPPPWSGQKLQENMPDLSRSCDCKAYQREPPFQIGAMRFVLSVEFLVLATPALRIFQL